MIAIPRTSRLDGRVIPQNRRFASRTVTVKWKAGLHLRPAEVLADTAAKFNARIRIGTPAGGFLCLKDERDLKTIHSGHHQHFDATLSCILLGAVKGTRLIIEAEGPDAHAALRAIYKVFQIDFDTIIKQAIEIRLKRAEIQEKQERLSIGTDESWE